MEKFVKFLFGNKFFFTCFIISVIIITVGILGLVFNNYLDHIRFFNKTFFVRLTLFGIVLYLLFDFFSLIYSINRNAKKNKSE